MYIPNEIIEEILRYIKTKHCHSLKLINKQFKRVSDYIHDNYSEILLNILMNDDVVKYESIIKFNNISSKEIINHKCVEIFKCYLRINILSKEELYKLYDELHCVSHIEIINAICIIVYDDKHILFIKHLLEHIDQRHDIVKFEIYDVFTCFNTDIYLITIYVNFKKCYKKYSKQFHDHLLLLSLIDQYCFLHFKYEEYDEFNQILDDETDKILYKDPERIIDENLV
jgi:hypothetical protein